MQSDSPLVAVTGAAGFIGKNLLLRLREAGFVSRAITRDTPESEVRAMIGESDFVFHLAGANRPDDPGEFNRSNVGFTRLLANAVSSSPRSPLVLFSSTAKAGEATDYGRSKLEAEEILLALASTVVVYRLPNVFGKWARPNYNSAIATFCHNVANGLPINVANPASQLALLHVDDLIDQWLDLLESPPKTSARIEPDRVHPTTVGAVATRIEAFPDQRRAGRIDDLGDGLTRALYATFVSYLPTSEFSYALPAHVDARGAFTEMVKSTTGGQVSCLTAHPGATRGGHYHHGKVERFLVAHGRARFRFRHVLTGETHEIDVSGEDPAIVETIPGWAHDITNVGDEILVALLWANEAFDPDRPDTMAAGL